MKDRTVKTLRYSVTVVIIISLVYLANLEEILSHLSNVKPEIYSLAVIVFLTVYLWSALRWKALISGLDYEITLQESIKTIAMSYGFNKILPMNSGDLTRSKLMERYTEIDSHGKVLGAVAMERFLDIVFLGVLTAASSFYLLGKTGNLAWIFVTAGVLTLLMISVRLKNRFFVNIIEFNESLGAPRKITEFLKESLRGYKEIPRSKLAEVFLWTSLRWLSGILVLYILSSSLGTPISLWGAALVTGVMSMVSALPITPAGIGPVEAMGTGILVVLGLSSAQAASLVILQRSLGFILMGVIGALVYSLD